MAVPADIMLLEPWQILRDYRAIDQAILIVSVNAVS